MKRLLIGGSPCTHWSIAQKNSRETKPEGLGWELFKNYLIAIEIYKPDYFLYENNHSISKDIKAEITKQLGVEPIMINSALVSAQSRKRMYWTNIPGVQQPKDKGILLKDILDNTFESYKEQNYALSFPINPTTNGKSRCLTARYHKSSIFNFVEGTGYNETGIVKPVRIGDIGSNSQGCRVYSCDGKSVGLNANGGGAGAKTGLYAVNVDPCIYQKPHGFNKGGIKYNKAPTMTARGCWQNNNLAFQKSIDTQQGKLYYVKNHFVEVNKMVYPIELQDGCYIIRKLTVNECKRLQTVPEGYLMPCSNTQNYKMLGNGWTVDVIAHILSYIPGISNEPVEVLSMYDGMSCGHIALDNCICSW